MGTPDFALPALAGIIAAGHEILAVYTQPPRRAGRGLEERLSPVHRFAADARLPVETPESLRSEKVQSALIGEGADAAVVIAYGLILPKALLNSFPLGSFNIHASLLPRWRGAAPVNRSIMAGDRETGVTIMRMTEGLDEGPICLSNSLAIREGETAAELHDRLAQEGASLMVEALRRLEQGTLVEVPQPEEGATYAPKIAKSETHIDFNRPARNVLDHIHGLSPFPGAWCSTRFGDKPQRLKIIKAEAVKAAGSPAQIIDSDFTIACGEGAIRPLIIQREGKAAMPRDEFLRGSPLKPGGRLE
ncbi:MAG TPA: methionyl-tRNA formyltransferase [Aestuariivirgaceae bacterium]|nr:methionyl-tRNA formyltransferase [Aestuariivirgaceae bacterium]